MIKNVQSVSINNGNPTIDGRGGHHISWTNMVQGKKFSGASELVLSFVPLTIINDEKADVCPIEEKENNMKHWKNTLVGYVLGKMP